MTYNHLEHPTITPARRPRPLLKGIICLFLGSKRPEKGMKFTPPSHYERRLRWPGRFLISRHGFAPWPPLIKVRCRQAPSSSPA